MKVNIGAVNALDPLPTTLVGAKVGGKPNYLAIAWVGIVGRNRISIALNKEHYTNAGIRENKCFSVNIPSESLVEKTDYCGIYSGSEVDKSKVFVSYYGALNDAPMIQECIINMECRLIDTIDTPYHDVFVGEVVATYCDEYVLVDGKIDLSRVKPILYSTSDKGYWTLGERLTSAWDIGKRWGK
ncbi:hypothetical protein A3K78_05070 [Candidatus Bathyarchaeota archaeon RBG_13_52_12]|nr:MAG: hypothetical protein A3K78_05070 [Candidatus Bathyarchaeota archaeon RBG_13_52_12]